MKDQMRAGSRLETRGVQPGFVVRRQCALLALAALASCAPPTPRPPGPPPACSIGSSLTAASLSISLSVPPLLRSSAPPFIRSQLYEPLLAADCDGQPQPVLAQSWALDQSRTRVTLVLRDGAQFTNGDPVSAADVVAAWRVAGQSSGEWANLARRLADATTVVDARTLLVSLPDTNLLVLAEPALAVDRQSNGSPWPEGTGPYRVGTSSSDAITLVPASGSGAPRLDIHMNGGDARDAIDGGADVVVTADPATIDYARTLPSLTTLALPWSTTYVLAAPGDVHIAAASFGDAVREETRAAESPEWWQGITGCEFDIPSTPPPSVTRDDRIAYDAGDDVARQLANRLVALGVAPAAARMSTSAFADALRSGSESAYVVAVPARSLAPCVDAALLLPRIPWLGSDPDALSSAFHRSSVPPFHRSSVIPLVDTRQHAIVRSDRVRATVDWEGTLHFAAPHRP
jgi:extracellular solute-binding protein (family 5)